MISTMNDAALKCSEEILATGASFPRLFVGFDLVQVSHIAHSISQFGDRFTRRLFTQNELDYASGGESALCERLAARFAAKEATIKALGLSDVGIGWRDIEVQRMEHGGCQILLHGRAADVAHAKTVSQIALSLSHDGDYAGAFVTVVC